MSLVAHPERNVIVTGRAGSPYVDVARVLAVRLNRRLCDVQAEIHKRKLLSLSGLLSTHKTQADLCAEVLRECGQRRNQVVCLNMDYLADVTGSERLLSAFFVTVLTDSPSDNRPDVPDGADPPWPLTLDSDLQLNWNGFQPRQLARIIAHCLYG